MSFQCRMLPIPHNILSRFMPILLGLNLGLHAPSPAALKEHPSRQ
jgi:hypothetical protein